MSKTGNPRNTKKVALVGTADISLAHCPWNDYDFTIYGLAWRQDQPRRDVLFDIHKIDATRVNVPQNYPKWLASTNLPVYMQDVHPDVPNSVRYPVEQMAAAYGDYFASSVAYMLCLALEEGFEEIHLYGIELLDDSEYAYQRPNAEYLLGVAHGKGRRVYVPPTSALLKFSHRYGYDNEPNHGGITKELLAEHEQRYNEIHEKSLRELYTADGAKQALANLRTVVDFSKKGRVNHG